MEGTVHGLQSCRRHLHDHIRTDGFRNLVEHLLEERVDFVCHLVHLLGAGDGRFAVELPLVELQLDLAFVAAILEEADHLDHHRTELVVGHQLETEGFDPHLVLVKIVQLAEELDVIGLDSVEDGSQYWILRLLQGS